MIAESIAFVLGCICAAYASYRIAELKYGNCRKELEDIKQQLSKMRIKELTDRVTTVENTVNMRNFR